MKRSIAKPSIACFDKAMVYLKSDGTVWGIGTNTNGIFGINPSSLASTNTWTQLPIDNVKKVFNINQGLYVVTNDGIAYYTGFPAKSRFTATYTTAAVNTFTSVNLKGVANVTYTTASNTVLFLTETGNVYYTGGGIESSTVLETKNTLTKATSLFDISTHVVGEVRVYHNETKNDGAYYDRFPVFISKDGRLLFRSTGTATFPSGFSFGKYGKFGEYTMSTQDDIHQISLVNGCDTFYTESASPGTAGYRDKYVAGVAVLLLKNNGDLYGGSTYDYRSSTNIHYSYNTDGYGVCGANTAKANAYSKLASDVKQYYFGGSGLVTVKNDGSVYVRGYNGYGALCTNDKSHKTGAFVKAQIDGVEAVSGYSNRYTVFLKKSGAVFVL